jgi:acetylornithine/N-succinyldiaminopimelate aminotransferase
MAAAGALLDVVLADGFLERVRHTALILKQKLAEIRDRHPDVIAEVRGEGLLVGLRAVVPSAQLVDALRAEKMITVAAGDNVVRLLPPLIVSEDEVAEAVRRIDRACAGIGKALQEPQRQGAAG